MISKNYFCGVETLSARKKLKGEHLTYKLQLISKVAISAHENIFLRETGLTSRELRVLRLIDDNDGITFVELCEMTAFDRTLTSRIVQKLIKLGLVLRKNDKIDARKFSLHTTSEGKNTRKIGRHLSNDLELILTDKLTSQEKETLDSLLDRMGAWVVSDEYLKTLTDY